MLPAHAEVVQWSFTGQVGALSSKQTVIPVVHPPGSPDGYFVYDYGNPIITYTVVPSIGNLATGQAFVSDFVVDLESNQVLSSSWQTQDGSVSFARTGSGSGALKSATYPRVIAGLDEVVYAPFVFAPFAISVSTDQVLGAGPGTDTFSAKDMNAILASGSYNALTSSNQVLFSRDCSGGGTGLQCSIGSASFLISGVSVTSVPEPTTALTLGLGLIGLGWTSLQRRRAKANG